MEGFRREPEDELPLTPAVLNILISLAGEEQHGYGIMKEVERRTGGKVNLGPGTLYRSIKQILEKRLIEESDERPDLRLDDQRRRYYRLTNFGQRVAVAELERLESLVGTGRDKGLLGGLRPQGIPGGA